MAPHPPPPPRLLGPAQPHPLASPPSDPRPRESRSPCPSPAEDGDPAWQAPEWRTLASRGRRPSCRGEPSAGPRRRAMRSTSPGGAIPRSRSQQGRNRRLTSARESGSRSAPEETPGTRGRLRVLRWALRAGQPPPSRRAGLLPVAAAGIPVPARRPAPPGARARLERAASQRSYSGLCRDAIGQGFRAGRRRGLL